MTSVELNERIARANAMCDKLNNERQLNLGKKETLTAQLESALKEYANQYGVNLTKDSLQTELNRVQSEKEAELTKVEQIIALINGGNYIEARRLAGETIEETENVLQLDTENVVDSEIKTKKAGRKPKVKENESINVELGQVENPVVPNVPLDNVATVVPPTVPVMPMTPTPVAPTVPSAPIMPVAPPTVPVTPVTHVDTPTVPLTPVTHVDTPTGNPIPVAPSMSVVPPTVPNMGIIPTPPTTPVAPNVLGGALEGFKPTDGMLNNVDVAPPTTFQSILGGTSFEG